MVSLLVFMSFSFPEFTSLKIKRLKKDLKKDFVQSNYAIKKIKIESINNGNIYNISLDDSLLGYLYIGRVNTCRTGGCSINSVGNTEASSEYFEYYIIFQGNKTIKRVRIFNYQATHGYQITAQSWLKQFKGYNYPQKLEVGKEVDAISGATTSVYAITADIEYNSMILNKLK